MKLHSSSGLFVAGINTHVSPHTDQKRSNIILGQVVWGARRANYNIRRHQIVHFTSLLLRRSDTSRLEARRCIVLLGIISEEFKLKQRPVNWHFKKIFPLINFRTKEKPFFFTLKWQISSHFGESVLILGLVRNFGISDMIIVEAVLPHQFSPISVEVLRRTRIAFICHSILMPALTAICRPPKVNLSDQTVAWGEFSSRIPLRHEFQGLPCEASPIMLNSSITVVLISP